MMKNAFYFILKAFFVLKYLNFCVEWHGVNVGPGHRDLEPQDPGHASKFKSGTRDTPQSLKVGPQDPLWGLKVGPPHFSLMNSLFAEYFIVFFLTYFCVSF